MPHSSVVPTSRPSGLVLRLGVRVHDVAFECREAATDFMYGVADGWRKPELAAWLLRSYRRLTSHVPPGPPSNDALRRTTLTHVDARDLADALRDARHRVLHALEAALPPERNIGFAVGALQRGHVTRASDTFGHRGWVPVDLPRMPLADRVLSLLAVYRLTCPEQFEAEVLGIEEEIELDDVDLLLADNA